MPAGEELSHLLVRRVSVNQDGARTFLSAARFASWMPYGLIRATVVCRRQGGQECPRSISCTEARASSFCLRGWFGERHRQAIVSELAQHDFHRLSQGVLIQDVRNRVAHIKH